MAFGNQTPTGADAASTLLGGSGQGLPLRSAGGKGVVGQISDAGLASAVVAGYNGVSGVGQQTLELGIGASGKIASVAAPLAETTVSAIVSDINAAKLIVDGATFGYGVYVCSK